MLGVRPELEGLRIAPCIPKSWPGFKMTRTFRGKRVKIEVQNPSGVNQGLKSLTIDGQPVEGEVIPTARIKHNSKIVAVLG